MVILFVFVSMFTVCGILQKGRHTVLRATPLLGVLLLIECSDIIFAIDSVPAAFSISTHPLIVYTSNILAILGLRQLYFVLEYVTDRFRYVRYGVAVILMFTGLKMLAVLVGIHSGYFVSSFGQYSAVRTPDWQMQKKTVSEGENVIRDCVISENGCKACMPFFDCARVVIVLHKLG